MCSASRGPGQAPEKRSAADRLCLGVGEPGFSNFVTEPDRRRSLDSSPNSRLSRPDSSSAASSHPQERDISMNEQKQVDMPNSISEVPPAPTIWVGIDVAKATLDLHINPSGVTCQLANDAAGYRAILQKLPAAGECLVVLEATGGYERALVAELRSESLTLADV